MSHQSSVFPASLIVTLIGGRPRGGGGGGGGGGTFLGGTGGGTSADAARVRTTQSQFDESVADLLAGVEARCRIGWRGQGAGVCETAGASTTSRSESM